MPNKYYGTRSLGPLQNYTLFLDTYRSIDFLIGPSEITCFTINNKLIILFGDIHIEPEKICKEKSNPWLHKFLIHLFKSSPICIDFFLETIGFLNMQQSEKYKKYESTHTKIKSSHLKFFKPIKRGMIKTMETFYECLSPYKRNCTTQYGNTRFHNIEFRRFPFQKQYNMLIDDTNSLIFFPIYYMLISPNQLIDFPFDFDTIYKLQNDITNKDILFDYNDMENPIYSYIKKLDTFEKIIENIINGDLVKLSENFIYLLTGFEKYFKKFNKIKEYYSVENLLNNSPYLKINKQLINLNKDIVDNYKKFILNEYIIQINKNIEKIKNISLPLNEKTVVKLFNYILNIFIDFGVIMVDIYTITRMLKSIFIYSDSSLIITYAGSTHTDRYIKFLKEYYLNNKIISINNNTDGCIPIIDNRNKWRDILNVIENQFKNPSQCKIKNININ